MKCLLIRLALASLIILLGGCEGGTKDPTKAVVEAPVATVSVLPDTASTWVGGIQPFTAILKDGKGNTLSNRTILWTTDNPNVATIQNETGVVTGIATGSATITASCEGKTGVASVSVTKTLQGPVVLEESYAGEFLVVDQLYTGSDTMWTVLFDNVVKQFNKTYADQNYDFIVLCPTKPMVSNWSMALNRHIDGIGGKPGDYPTAPNLHALIAFDLFPLWNIGFPAPNSTLLNGVLIHEIGHYWLVDIQWPQHVAIGHWQNNLDLFSGDKRYIDPMAYSHWIINNGQESCVDGYDPAVTTKFSDLSLYIMGLLPPDQVLPIYEQEFELKLGNDYYNMWGPDCGDAHRFTGTRTITIQDIINTNGVRNPTSIQSKKDFRVAFIVVTSKGETASSEFVDYVKNYSDALPGAWSQITGGKSSMIIN